MTLPLVRTLRLVPAGAFALMAALFTACGGGGDGDPIEPQPASITPVSADGQIVPPSTVVEVSARVSDASGQPLSGVTVTWTVASGGGSVSPPSSTTNASGIATTQWTLGSAAGVQTLTATAGSVSRTFTATARATTACASPVTLAVGGICLASASVAANLSVAGGSSGSEFVAVPYFDAGFTRQTTQITVSTTGALPVTGPPNPSITPSSPVFSRFGEASTNLVPNYAFESRLRRRERRELPRFVSAARARRRDALAGSLAEPSFSASGPLEPVAPRRVVVGEQLTLNTNSSNACSNPVNKTAVVRAVSANAALIEDTQNPAGFTQADYDAILASFESNVWPVDTTNFGAPTDIDGNKQVYLFYTIEVNKLTPASSTAFVGGFFFSRDLFPKTQSATLGACAASNVAEMFYLLAPDPSGQFGRTWSVSAIRRQTVGTVAHELQHLINSARRLYINTTANWPEEAWMEEGLSHIAEELVFYRVTNLSPRSNLDSIAIRQPGVIDATNEFQVANFSRFNSWVKNPSAHSPFGDTDGHNDDDLETRGAMWSFLRWVADHRATSDGDVWRRLVNSADTSFPNLRGVFGQALNERFREWAAANYTDDAVNAGVPFTHPSWNYRTILPLFETPRTFRLQTRQLSDASPTTIDLVEGGAAYVRFGVAASANATVRFNGAGGGQMASGASVWIIRTK